MEYAPHIDKRMLHALLRADMRSVCSFSALPQQTESAPSFMSTTL